METVVEVDLFSELLEFADKNKNKYDETKLLISNAYQLHDLFGKIYTDLESLDYFDFDDNFEDIIELKDSIRTAYEEFDDFTTAVFHQSNILREYLEYIDTLFEEVPIEDNGKAVWIPNPVTPKLKPMEIWQTAMILSQLAQIYNHWDEMKIEAMLAAAFAEGLETQLEAVTKFRDNETLKKALLNKVLAREQTYEYDTSFGYELLDTIQSELDDVLTNLRDWMEDVDIDKADLNSIVDAQHFIETALHNVLLPFTILGLEYDY